MNITHQNKLKNDQLTKKKLSKYAAIAPYSRLKDL